MLKVELHAHTANDPCDYIPHSTRDLIDRASALGYDALAVTLHDRYYDPADDRDYASGKGVLLIAGVERTLASRHVLLVNFPPESATVRDFADIRDLKARHPHGLVVAPHAFYPIGSALRRDVERWADVIDALEVNSMFTRWLNFNSRAVRWARAHGKPLVGNTDLHLLGADGHDLFAGRRAAGRGRHLRRHSRRPRRSPLDAAFRPARGILLFPHAGRRCHRPLPEALKAEPRTREPANREPPSVPPH